jgi:hypothetical protein
MAFCRWAAAQMAQLPVVAGGIEGVKDAKIHVQADKFVFKGLPIRCKLVGVYSDAKDIPIRKNELIKP